MYNKDIIYRDAKQIFDESKKIKPYVVIAQPRRNLEEMPAQNLDGYNTHIDLRGYSHGFANIGGEKVDVARNYLMGKAIESGAKYLLFVGEDTVLPYDGFLKLHETCEKNSDSCAVGVYYMKISTAPMVMIRKDDWVYAADVTPGQIFPIWQAGMDAMLIPISILEKMYKEEPDNPFCCIINNIEVENAHIEFIGEDNYFYNRLHKMGIPILCNTDVQCLHMDLATGKYTAYKGIDLDNYITNIPITEVLKEKDRKYIEQRWVNRLPKGSFNEEYLHINTAMDRHLDFMLNLIKNKNPKTYVELGVHYGGCYFNICKIIKENNLNTKCFGIDHWKGDKNTGYYQEDVYENVNKYNEENFKDFSILLRHDTIDGLNILPDESIDILFIDASHEYENVKKDFYEASSKMAINGIILFHDINIKNVKHCEVWKFWEEIKEKYNGEEIILSKEDEGIGVIKLSNIK